MAAQEKVDAAIIGAGPAGAIYADVLSRAGKKVIILEFGPDWDDGDLISSELWGKRLKHTPRAELAGKNPVALAFNAGWGAGGSAVHYYGNFPRLLPADFRVKSLHGKGLDWPISYEDLAPCYDQVARDLGVSGDAEQERRWRPVGDAYPMPPLQTFRHAEIWRGTFDDAGLPLAPMPTAINSVEYNGRPACSNDGWCHVGCPTGAHGTPKWSHLGAARSRSVELRPSSYVTRILTSDKGDRATGVEYYDARGERQVQEASAVVLAAFSAETPRILLNSASAAHPDGLANRNRLVGKYVMCHTGAIAWAMFDEALDNHMGTSAYQLMSYASYAKDRPARGDPGGGFGSAAWLVGSAMKPNAGMAGSRADLFGPPLEDFMRRAVRGLTRVTCYGEEMPSAENRVELSSEKDAFGFPVARIVHGFDQDAVELWRGLNGQALGIARAAKPAEAWTGGGAAPPTIHMNGGTVMGTGAGNSVANGYGQTHEVANLFLGGSGLFPTEGALHPTNTLMAVALRGAGHMARNWGGIVG